MSSYGYLHTARVVGQDETSGGWYVQSVALARDRRWGPIPSCVAGLTPGDKVVLAATGTTRDNLLILGALDPRYPDLDDIPGLAAALAAKADLSALNALSTLVDGRLDGHDADIATLQAADVSLDGRLDTAESTIASHTATLASNSATIGTHTTQIATIQQYQQVFQAAHEFDVYGDLYSDFPRLLTTSSRQMVNQTAYIWRTRVRVAGLVARLRAICAAVGVGAGGNTTAAIYTSSTAAGPYSLASSGTNALTALGSQQFPLTASVSTPAGTYLVLLLLCNNSYTTAPRIACVQNAVNQVAALNPTIIWGTKAGQTTPPASITITDGTWTADGTPWWVAAAN